MMYLKKVEIDVTLNRDYLKLILKKEIEFLRSRISKKRYIKVVKKYLNI